jgi:hypothetical protein
MLGGVGPARREWTTDPGDTYVVADRHSGSLTMSTAIDLAAPCRTVAGAQGPAGCRSDSPGQRLEPFAARRHYHQTYVGRQTAPRRTMHDMSDASNNLMDSYETTAS